jgi:hypothetical protein
MEEAPQHKPNDDPAMGGASGMVRFLPDFQNLEQYHQTGNNLEQALKLPQFKLYASGAPDHGPSSTAAGMEERPPQGRR